LAIVALLVITSSASAIMCTVDKRPAATLLVPYFAASFNNDGSVDGTGVDTIVTIANASDAPMIAHVNVFNKRSELVLDFNIALTGFDVQPFRMSDVISGKLPTTGDLDSHGNLIDACQRNSAEFPSSNYGTFAPFLRICPPAGPCTATGNLPNPATGFDNTQATTLYAPGGAFSFADSFGQQVLDSLDQTTDTRACGGVDGVIVGPAEGYVTIDMVNYCTVSDPTQGNYYVDTALGMENNLWGDVVFETGTGIGTFAGSLVHVEADTFGNWDQSFVNDATRCPAGVPCRPTIRTFYARYLPNPGLFVAPTNPSICANFPWECPLGENSVGDLREPLGLKYAARWANTTGLTSNFSVWRASAGELTDLLNDFEGSGKSGGCLDIEPVVQLTFWDEDENKTATGTCPSPCRSTKFNFPLETQHTNIAAFVGALPTAPAGWVNMSFFNASETFACVGCGNYSGHYDQAYVLYDWEGPSGFISFQDNGAQLDPSACYPLGLTQVPPFPEDPHAPGDVNDGGDPHIVGTGN
jgi:hypothetical protein